MRADSHCLCVILSKNSIKAIKIPTTAYNDSLFFTKHKLAGTASAVPSFHLVNKSAPPCLKQLLISTAALRFLLQNPKNLRDLGGLWVPETQQRSPTQMYIYLVSFCSCALSPDIGSSVLRQAASLQLPNDFVVREEHGAHLITPARTQHRGLTDASVRLWVELRPPPAGRSAQPQGCRCSATRDAHACPLLTCELRPNETKSGAASTPWIQKAKVTQSLQQ